jgi:transposase
VAPATSLVTIRYVPRTRTTLNPALTGRIVELVQAGNYIETAAKAAGIHKSTYYSWMNRGEKAAEAIGRGDPVSEDEAAFADFYNQVSQAEAVAETNAVAAVREADRGWQAHMTYLERRFSSRWRQQSGARYVRDDSEKETMEQMLERMQREQGERGAA